MADGFEDIEALIPLDIMRRAGMDFRTVSITGALEVTSAHGVTMKADMTFDEGNFDDADLLMLPGGMPGAENLNRHDGVKKAITAQAEKGGLVAAICAAPMVLGGLGLLKGKRATCYPGFENFLDGAEYTAELCTADGNIVTGEGPAAALPYAYTLLSMLGETDKAHAIADGMRYVHLMEK